MKERDPTGLFSCYPPQKKQLIAAFLIPAGNLVLAR